MCSLTDADARQAFMDILANDVIRPLEKLKVSKEEYLVSEGIPVLMARKDLNNKTSGSTKVSKYLQRVMRIMQRLGSRSSNKDT